MQFARPRTIFPGDRPAITLSPHWPDARAASEPEYGSVQPTTVRAPCPDLTSLGNGSLAGSRHGRDTSLISDDDCQRWWRKPPLTCRMLAHMQSGLHTTSSRTV